MNLSDSRRLVARHQAAQKRRWLKGLAFVLLFVLIGVVIGVGATLVFMKDRMHRLSPRRDAIAEAMVEKMREHVTVAPEEEARLIPLLQGYFGEVEELRNTSFENMRDVFVRMDRDIESVLGPERFKIWYDYKEARLAEWRQRRERK